jgi:hypothetical protein
MSVASQMRVGSPQLLLGRLTLPLLVASIASNKINKTDKTTKKEEEEEKFRPSCRPASRAAHLSNSVHIFCFTFVVVSADLPTRFLHDRASPATFVLKKNSTTHCH